MTLLSERQIKIAKWYLRNKKRIRVTFLIIVILLNVIFWGIAIYQLINYLSFREIHQKNIQDLTENRIDFSELHDHFKPKELIIEKSTALRIPLSGSEDSEIKEYDFISLVKNINASHVALIKYYFSWTNGQTEIKENFILPGERKYLLSLKEQVNNDLQNLEFIISSVEWERVQSNDEKLQIPQEIEIKNITLDHEIDPKKMIAIPKISFNIFNQSIYDFWETNFQVILFQGNRIVGVNTISVKNILSNKKKEIELFWPQIPDYNQILINPEINPFNPDIFIPVY